MSLIGPISPIRSTVSTANSQPQTANRKPPTVNRSPLPAGSNVDGVRSLEHTDRVKRWSIGNQDTLLAD